MDRRTFTRALASLALPSAAASIPLLPSLARAAPLTRAEHDALNKGECVRRAVDAELESGVYLGGVSYCIAEAPAPFVLDMLKDVSLYKRILALTLEASPVGTKGKDQLVFFKHGGKLGTASYTMRIQPADPSGVIRFWMDPAFDHEIEDIWGFVRVEPLAPARCLATYAVLCDLGTVLRLLFGEKVRDFALDTPEHIRWVAADRYSASQRDPEPEAQPEYALPPP
ncbi:MAG: hypothetical protein R3B70_48145 [Polyangiaceae bacterium]